MERKMLFDHATEARLFRSGQTRLEAVVQHALSQSQQVTILQRCNSSRAIFSRTTPLRDNVLFGS